MSAGDWVHQLLVIAASVELVDVVHPIGSEHPIGRYTSPDEFLHDLIWLMLANPSGKHLVERVVVFEPGPLRCESRVVPQFVKTDGLDDGGPIRIVSDGDGHPLVPPGGRVDALRIGSVSVSLTWADFPRQRVLDDGLGRNRRTDLDLCNLDELPRARAASVFKGGQQGNGGVHTRDRIGG